MEIRKKRVWMIVSGLLLITLLLTACSSGQTSDNQPSQGLPMMTGTPIAGAPGQMMNTTPGAQAPATGMDFDQMFINMMVPHHQGAVEMAKIAQQRAEHTEIKQMADAIISGQQEEITQMKDWKKQWYGSSDTPPMSGMPMLEAMPGMGSAGHTMNMQADVDQLKTAKEPFDLAFIDAMIPHHQSAIDAAQLALKQATHPEIKQLAQTIINAQQKEIDQMNAWRKAWYPDAAPVSTPTVSTMMD